MIDFFKSVANWTKRFLLILLVVLVINATFYALYGMFGLGEQFMIGSSFIFALIFMI